MTYTKIMCCLLKGWIQGSLGGGVHSLSVFFLFAFLVAADVKTFMVLTLIVN